MAAQADGFEFAQRVESLTELEEKLRAFIDFAGPAFLEVMIDRTPMCFR
jgi:acetolactate synthase-1/2/3 large subunit